MAKRQDQYTISDIIRLGPEWIKKKQTDLALFNELVHRIAVMMDHGFNFIAPYKFIEVFGTYDISTMEMNEINRLIVEFKNQSPEVELEGNAAIVEKAIEDKKLEFNIGKIKSEIVSLDSDIDNNEYYMRDYISQAKSKMERANECREQASSCRIKKEALEEKVEACEGLVDKDKVSILNNIPDHYKIVDIQKETFTVIRTTEVIMTETNANSGVSRYINMGYYGFTFNFTLGEVDRFNLCNNIEGGYGRSASIALHPHVNTYICWGSLETQVERAQQKLNSSKLFYLLDSLLENYNSGSPFTSYDVYNRRKMTHRKRVKFHYYEKYPEIFQYIKETTTDDVLKETIEELQGKYNPATLIKTNTDEWYNLGDEISVSFKPIEEEKKEENPFKAFNSSIDVSSIRDAASAFGRITGEWRAMSASSEPEDSMISAGESIRVERSVVSENTLDDSIRYVAETLGTDRPDDSVEISW